MSAEQGKVNLLTFDIEGFVESSLESLAVPEKYQNVANETREIETNTLAILDVLAELKQKGTFFILGRIARDLPGLVKKIASDGHEIGCHSLEHKRLYNFPEADVKEIVTSAKKYLEDVSGKPVRGFRAPDFSITKDNLWTFDLLKEAGYEYDSSVYPTSLHDVYGIDDFPRGPFRFPNGLIEIPMSTAVLGGKNIPFGGGGYLRLYPLSLTKMLFRRLNNENIPGVIYLHPFEIGVAVTRFKEISFRKKFRTYVGIRSIKAKLARLLGDFSFMAAEDYLKTQQIKGIPDGIFGQENIRTERS